MTNNNQNIPAKGLVLCHGRTHRSIPDRFLNSGLIWYYVDNKLSTKPDFLQNIYDANIVQKLGPSSYTAILVYHCPSSQYKNIIDILSNTLGLLKPGGILYFTSLVSFIIGIYLNFYSKIYREVIIPQNQIQINPGSALDLFSHILDKYTIIIDDNPEMTFKNALMKIGYRKISPIIKNLYSDKNVDIINFINSALQDLIQQTGYKSYGTIVGSIGTIAFVK